MTVAHQKIVKIKKTKIQEDRRYIRIDMQTLQNAMNDLKGETFKM